MSAKPSKVIATRLQVITPGSGHNIGLFGHNGYRPKRGNANPSQEGRSALDEFQFISTQVATARAPIVLICRANLNG